MSELDRALDFIVRADMFGSRHVPFELGTAVFEARLPLRHDSNYLFLGPLPPSVDAKQIAAHAEALQGAAGLSHRSVLFRRSADGDRLAPQLHALGWTTFEGVVMRLKPQVEPRAPAPSSVRIEAVDLEQLRTAREQQILTYPWATAEVARQLAGARRLSPIPVRHFAVRQAGRAVAWVDLILEGETAQVEELATVAPARGQGHARALMEHAILAAREAGAGFVFLCADASDWPREFYARLGFETIGRYVKCTRLKA